MKQRKFGRWRILPKHERIDGRVVEEYEREEKGIWIGMEREERQRNRGEISVIQNKSIQCREGRRRGRKWRAAGGSSGATQARFEKRSTVTVCGGEGGKKHATIFSPPWPQNAATNSFVSMLK
ncbi:hypothetical protein PIB30_021509 [Stylosanthes scabra]|uniref:Uncharacterized protein n=1 Tax=Stylosanthes scabra TaxID=79078 RepID=A0ABU6QAD5_9FABA|nr:hypothetical protein [Stylosanthes scabra]